MTSEITSFEPRRIDVTITLGAGQFGANVGDTMTLTGYRVQAYINQWGGDTQGTAQARIYGLPIDTLNRLTSVGPLAPSVRAGSTVQIAAGIDGQALSTVFLGTIYGPNGGAWAEMQEAPNTALVVEGAAAAVAALQPVGASSYSGATQVSSIMSDLAKEGGFAFENNGVQVVLDNPYFPGSTLTKIQACARAAGIYYDIHAGVLAIWPGNGSRVQSDAHIITPWNGLVGYPTYSQQGIQIRTLFDPRFALGKQFTIQKSLMTPANRTWNTYSVSHSLESQTPNGAWFTDVMGWPDE